MPTMLDGCHPICQLQFTDVWNYMAALYNMATMPSKCMFIDHGWHVTVVGHLTVVGDIMMAGRVMILVM